MQTQLTRLSWAKERSKYLCAPITLLIHCNNLKQELAPLPGHRDGIQFPTGLQGLS